MKKSISILGSTGSIGVNAISLIKQNINKYNVYSLVAKNNVKLLIKQSLLIKPKVVVIQNEKKYKELKKGLSGKNIKIYVGDNGIEEAMSKNVDIVISSIIGIAGLKPTLTAIPHCKTLCLANKECLVSSGNYFINLIKKHKCNLLPMDSEHNAVFQLINSDNNSDYIKSIILTASGGPFHNYTFNQLNKASLASALKHPNWKMGKKITIDSATLMNKALEIIEAFYLFKLKPEQIDVVVHPESIIHSLVNHIDGNTTAVLSYPDMKIPISYALNWPKRSPLDLKNLNLLKIQNLSFKKPNLYLKSSLEMAYYSIKKRGSFPCILNAANEIAVKFFLEKKIGFLDIIKIIKYVLYNSKNKKIKNITDIYEIDESTRQFTTEYILKKNGSLH